VIPLQSDYGRARHRIDTGLGGIVEGRFIFCGYDVTHEIGGKMTQTEAFLLLFLQRKPEPFETRLMDALITLNIYPDIRIWCIRAGAFAAAAGSPVSSAYGAAHAALNAKLFGVKATLAFRHFLMDLASRTEREELETVVDGMVARKTFFPGFGRPLIKGPDERVERLKKLLEEWRYPTGAYTRLFLGFADLVTEKTELHPNYASIFAALLMDPPFRLNDSGIAAASHFIVNICSIAPICEIADREAGALLLPLRVDDVDYRGIPDRKVR
jgi:hypothetical protein